MCIVKWLSYLILDWLENYLTELVYSGDEWKFYWLKIGITECKLECLKNIRTELEELKNKNSIFFSLRLKNLNVNVKSELGFSLIRTWKHRMYTCRWIVGAWSIWETEMMKWWICWVVNQMTKSWNERRLLALRNQRTECGLDGMLKI